MRHYQLYAQNILHPASTGRGGHGFPFCLLNGGRFRREQDGLGWQEEDAEAVPAVVVYAVP